MSRTAAEKARALARRAAILAIVRVEPGVTRAKLSADLEMTRTEISTYITHHIRREEVTERDGGLYLVQRPATKPVKAAVAIVPLRLTSSRHGSVTRRHDCGNLGACESAWIAQRGGDMAYCPAECPHMVTRARRDRDVEMSASGAWMEGV